jgi:hypothetical protein
VPGLYSGSVRQEGRGYGGWAHVRQAEERTGKQSGEGSLGEATNRNEGRRLSKITSVLAAFAALLASDVEEAKEALSLRKTYLAMN